MKLYGTLSRSFDAYHHSSGLDIVLPDGASINNLLEYLHLADNDPEKPRLGMITMNGKPARKETELKENARIKIFQPIFGG